jgi:hypothetical protein
MANYAASVLAKGQAVVTARNQAPEQRRRKMPTVMELALQNQEYSIPNANDLRKSDLRTVEIYYQKNVAAGATTAKAYNHTGSYGDSGSVTLTYVTHVEKIQLPRKIAQNNIVTYEQMFANLYEMKWKNLRTRHDTSALAYLFAQRCQLSAATINAIIASANPGVWEDTNFSLGIDASNKAVFMQKLKSFMAARYYTGEYDVVADLQIADAFELAMQQGQANNVNTSFQFAGANVSKTQDVISSAYGLGSVLAMPAKSFAALQWNDPLNRKGVSSGENNVGILTTANDPLGSGAVADISMYTNRADTSSNTSGGSTQDIVDEWEIAVTIAYALPPLATASDSVVHLIGQNS